ncbi:hypothetical protein, partial [Nostoc sp.]|uniref:hypothetical protein n=1 Tax=Nostoc sp. TaxID=1180 RepID=UPI002FFBED50
RAPIYKSPHVEAFSVFTYLYIVRFFYAHLLNTELVLVVKNRYVHYFSQNKITQVRIFSILF